MALDMNDPQAVGLEFAQIVTGTRVVDGPPSADSPLGKILAFVEEYGEGALRPEHFDDARAGRPLLP